MTLAVFVWHVRSLVTRTLVRINIYDVIVQAKACATYVWHKSLC